MSALTRRGLLQTLTVGAGSMALVDPTLRGVRQARAADPLPRRIIIFPIANGVADYPDIVLDGSTATSFRSLNFVNS